MSRKGLFKYLSLLAALSMMALSLGACSDATSKSGGGKSSLQTPEEVIRSATYVGSTKCLSCHGDKINWGKTLHKAVLRAPGSFTVYQEKAENLYSSTINAGLNALTGGQTIYFDFDSGTSKWSASTSSGPNTKYSAAIAESGGAYTLTITDFAGTSGSRNYNVFLTYGGERNYKQRYIVEIGRSKHLSPIQYNDKGTPGVDQWVEYHAERWYNTSSNVLAEPANKDAFDGNCAGCHFTGLTVQNIAGEEVADAVDDPNGTVDFDGDGTMDEINIGCERCHGPGSVHVTTLNPAFITNPEDLTPERADMVCGQCHIRGKSIDTFDVFAEGTAEAPFPALQDSMGEIQTYVVGFDDINSYYTWDSGTGIFDSQYWGGEPSGGTYVASVKHHQQYIDKLQGAHNPSSTDEDIPRCFSCHEMHDNRSPGAHQVVTTVEEDGILIKTENDNDSLCLACHAEDAGPFVNVPKDEVEKMFTSFDLNSEIANVKTFVVTHTKHYFDPTNIDGNNNGVSRCSKCHMPKTAKSALNYDIHAHTFNIIEPDASLSTAPSAGVPNSCTACHSATNDTELNALQTAFADKFATGTNMAADEWVTSDHADYAGEPFNHWNDDGEISTSCARCHSKDGFIDYVLDESVDSPARLGTVISCGACHTNGESPDLYTDLSTRWDDRATYTALASVLFPSGDTADLGDSSNLCMVCHQGRASTVTVDGASPNTVVQSPDYDSYDFINIHYFAAAASLFGTSVRGGYEYSTKTYVGQNTHVPTRNTCIECHMNEPAEHDHTFEPKTTSCFVCHPEVNSTTEVPPFRAIRITSIDYDGNGDTTSGIYHEIWDVLTPALLAEIQNYATSVLGSPVVYSSGNYPYYFNDTNANGLVDPGENIFPNRYRDFDLTLLKAAYNYQVVQKEPCGYVHNYKYIIQLIYDSIEDLGGTVSSFTRP